MRLVARKAAHAWVEEGMEIDRHVVERVLDGHPGAELRYLVRARDGSPATLVTPRRPYTDRGERTRVRRLAHRRADLQHPALIAVRSFGEHAGQPYLITDAYPRWTFGDLLAREGPVAPDRLVAMLAPIAEVLDLAHSRGLVHLTLDGDSLLLAAGDRLLFDSFGVLGGDDDTAWSIIQPGDLRYRPPEQVRGEPLAPWGNVYSLTALIVHALTGSAPYAGDRPAVTYAHLADAPPHVSERAPHLGRDIDAVVEWGMSKDPAERPASAAVLLRAVSEALGTAPPELTDELAPARLHLVPNGPRPGSAHAGAPVVARPATWPAPPRRHGRSVVAATVAAVALAAGCGAVAAAVIDPFGSDSPAPTADPAAATAWDRLAERRTELRTALAEAETPQEQAAAIGALASAYSAAARSDSPPPLRAAARDAAEAHSDLAAAASAGDEAAFADASQAVERAERSVVAAAAR
jgi:hypothetical protein